MIYIHRLYDLNPKSADIESVELLRSLRKSPFSFIDAGTFSNGSEHFFLSETDKELMSKASHLIPQLIQEISDIATRKDPIYEELNLMRALTLLTDAKDPLVNNIDYCHAITRQRGELLNNFVNAINAIPKLKATEEKIKCNEKLKSVFKSILRHDDFVFNSESLVQEGEVENISSLLESMKNGFIIRFTIEEDIKKIKFTTVRNRLPKHVLEHLDSMITRLEEIKKGIKRAYDFNIGMIELSIIMYAHVKWAMGA